MRIYVYKLVLIGVIVFLLSQSQLYGQEKTDYINLNYILVKLTFTSRISHPNEEINKQLIKEIIERKVDFILTTENERAIKEVMGNDKLLQAIRENAPKTIKEEFKIKEILRLAKELKTKEELERKLNNLDEKSRFFAEAEILYEKFLSHRKGDTVQKIEIAFKAGKEFIEKYADEKKINEAYRQEAKERFKEIIEYIKKQILRLKEQIEQ